MAIGFQISSHFIPGLWLFTTVMQVCISIYCYLLHKCPPNAIQHPHFYCFFFFYLRNAFSQADLTEMCFCVLSCLLRALTLISIQWDFCLVAKRPFSLVTQSHSQLLHTWSCLLLWSCHCHPRSAVFYFFSMGDSMWWWQLVLNTEWIIKKAQKATTQGERFCLKDSEAYSKESFVCLFAFNHRWVTPMASSHTHCLQEWVLKVESRLNILFRLQII